MTREELEKQYEKKPRATLVMDCAYLEEERNKERQENQKLRQEIHDLKHQGNQAGRSIACLKDAVNKLLSAIPEVPIP